MHEKQTKICSKDNPQLKLVKSLQQKKFRKELGLYMIEGVRNCEAALGGDTAVVKAFYSESLLQTERGVALLAAIRSRGIPVFLCDETVLVSCSDATTCQGIILLAEISAALGVGEVSGFQVLVLDGVQDPGNLGTILRTAWAAGIQTVALLPDTVDPYSPKVVRAAMGALAYIRILFVADSEAFYRGLREKDYEIWTTCVDRGVDYHRVKKGEKWALVIGGEANGVREVSLSAATHLVTIPMAEGAESLNVAVAAGILMFD